MDHMIELQVKKFPSFYLWRMKHAIRIPVDSRTDYSFRNLYAQARCMYIYGLFEKKIKEYADEKHPDFMWYPARELVNQHIVMTSSSSYKLNAFPFPDSTLLNEFILLCGIDLFHYFDAL